MINRLPKSWRKKRSSFIDPDEIFLDSKNLENFDTQQFEGRIEKPISKRTILFTGIFFALIVVSFSSRLGYLQIQKGEAYLKRSESNTLERQVIFADRGIIFDRNKKELAWNAREEGALYPTRTYRNPGFAHVLGYISYPAKDKNGFLYQTEFIGKDGLEKQYNDRLEGINGSKIVETNAHNEVQSENSVNPPKHGADFITTLDARVQSGLFNLIKELSAKGSFAGGAGVIMDVENGEIITSVSYPEYDGAVLSLGKNREVINGYFQDKRKVFLDRAISGLYTPGSIVKPMFAIAALTEGIIDPYKQILSTGSLSIPNPYLPGEKTVFKDWRVNGWTDMREAIAVSSDVYFYEIGGGFEGQRGLGISNIEKYSRMFGIGEKTGVDLPDEKSGNIPNPEWKAKNFDGDIWRIGDTYHTAIGQYGFQVTPLEMVRMTAAIANGGTLVNPHFAMEYDQKETKQVELNSEYFQIAREGMRQAVTSGTAVALNVPYVQMAAKTGTAQVGVNNSRVNSWVVGFFPFDKPKYAFTIMMEAGIANSGISGSTVMRGLIDKMYWDAPEYFGITRAPEPERVPVPEPEPVEETPTPILLD